eukprot:SAG31_NODE_4039_length_3643_cov_51.767212_2_plen_112_part_00
MCACAGGGWRVGRWLAAWHGARCGRAVMTERPRVRCACVRVWLSARGGADNWVHDAGAVALAKALESGKCQLTSLDLSGEWMERRCAHVRVAGGGWGAGLLQGTGRGVGAL